MVKHRIEITVHGVDRVAYKTGTSYGFRDSWAAGVAGEHVIIVWTGRPDGAPRPGRTGRISAAPLLFDLAAPLLGQTARPAPRKTEAPSALKQVDVPTDEGPVLLFPSDGAEILQSERGLSLSVDSDAPVRIYVGGEAVPDKDGLTVWRPRTPGFYRVRAVDALGRSTHADIRVVARDQLSDAPPHFR